MALVDGINHVAFVTNDFDRLADFYRRIFDATIAADIKSQGIRHGFIELGPACVLHPFEFPDSDQTKTAEMFQRGRLDHIAINAPSMEAFETIKDRLVADGASDGTITDFGAVLSVFFRDPDGMEAEVCVMKDSWSSAKDPRD